MDSYTIMIVDDNENNLITLKEVLKQLEDCIVVEARSGEEALMTLLRHKIHLIILDIQLPDMNGYEIARIIKSRRKTMDIPIIFATAIFKTEEFIQKGYKIGAIDYLFKPIREEQLLNKINFYMELYKKQNDLTHKLMKINIELENQNRRLEKTQDRLGKSEKMWRYLGENVPDQIILVDNQHKILFINKPIFHEDIKQNIGKSIYHFISPEYEEKIKEIIGNVFEMGNFMEYEEKRISVDGSMKWYLTRAVPITNTENIDHVMLVSTDITERKQSENRIKYLSFHDGLTGLYNRNYLEQEMQRLDMELPLSIIMADMNGLKLINDVFGHYKGDEALKQAAKILNSSCREEDIIARWGGDEFLILMPNTHQRTANEIANRIRKNTEVMEKEDSIQSHLAIGVATKERIEQDLSVIVEQAENRMYRNKLRDTKSFRSSVIESLKKTLLEKDYETKAHTERIEKISLQMANTLGLPEEEVDNLSLLATLHDIGKIGIPDPILLKPGKLFDEEWEIIKRHPEIGYNICCTIPELGPIAEMILCHHERWDGQGYPQGLKNGEIPLLSRIISIADAYDVMTHKRPYKGPISHEEAMRELIRCSGIQFDPNLVRVFCNTNLHNI